MSAQGDAKKSPSLREQFAQITGSCLKTVVSGEECQKGTCPHIHSGPKFQIVEEIVKGSSEPQQLVRELVKNPIVLASMLHQSGLQRERTIRLEKQISDLRLGVAVLAQRPAAPVKEVEKEEEEGEDSDWESLKSALKEGQEQAGNKATQSMKRGKK